MTSLQSRRLVILFNCRKLTRMVNHSLYLSSTVNPSEMQRKAPPRRWRHHNRAPLTHKMNKMVMSEEQMKLPSTKKSAGVPSSSEETATTENRP
ncbi:endogenous retrovirus group K member 19 Rec protein-like [Chlorocebus sabaeus]|uniref:endogenous retrovirus group K member 19 Rec protein-like n=1 Tax=Chlorocebus sabaeus TaxID=60711 RepID=UPI003BF96AF4